MARYREGDALMSRSPDQQVPAEPPSEGSRSGRLLTRLVWLLVVGSFISLVASFVLANTSLGVGSAIVTTCAAVLAGGLQSKAVIRGLSGRRLAVAPTKSRASSDVVKVLLAEYSQVRTTRNLASESGARLFQYYQIAIIASLALILPDANADPLGLRNYRRALTVPCWRLQPCSCPCSLPTFSTGTSM